MNTYSTFVVCTLTFKNAQSADQKKLFSFDLAKQVSLREPPYEGMGLTEAIGDDHFFAPLRLIFDNVYFAPAEDNWLAEGSVEFLKGPDAAKEEAAQVFDKMRGDGGWRTLDEVGYSSGLDRPVGAEGDFASLNGVLVDAETLDLSDRLHGVS